MRVKALKTFVGLVSMVIGEERDIREKYILDDLLRAGYIVPVKPTKKRGKKNESEPDNI